jgi:hypothetical protein
LFLKKNKNKHSNLLAMKTLLKTVICTFALSALFAFNASADDKEAKKITGFSTGIYTCVSGKVNVNIDKYN